MESLVKLWSGQEILFMVTFSFGLQLLLLFTGNLRRRRISGFLTLTVWLAYVGADAVAVFAIGLLSQYEDKYKSGSHTPWDTLPFLWGPFLLVHLGGQDTITAFSIEDNNLWLRHTLNLIIQVLTILYAFLKSRDLIEKKLIGIAVTVFVAGIIKYLERIWALYQGSRDNLVNGDVHGDDFFHEAGRINGRVSGHIIASYARNMVVYGKGLFAGRKVSQLRIPSEEVHKKFIKAFIEIETKQEEVVEMELGMMYDLLYTKAMVLQSWAGLICHVVSQLCIVGAFVNFLITAKDANDRANVAITYTLFIGAIFVEVCSVSMSIASPWIAAFFEEGSFLFWFSSRWICSPFRAMQRRRQQIGYSMGQFNLADFTYSTQESISLNLASWVVRSIGLERKWMNIWHVKHVEEDKEILSYIDKLFGSSYPPSLTPLEVGPELKSLLSMSFELAIFCLHIYTDFHIRRHHEVDGEKLSGIARECKILSNYMMYLMLVHPSMLPVSSIAAQDMRDLFPLWVMDVGESTKVGILTNYAGEIKNIPKAPSSSPFKTNPKTSLDYIKEVWVRLLMYAAARCPGEEHARQLANGGEALTSVWALLMHHDVGSVGSHELRLLGHGDLNQLKTQAWEPVQSISYTTIVESSSWPLYAFNHPESHQANDAVGQAENIAMEQPARTFSL